MITVEEEVKNKYVSTNGKLFKFKGLASDEKPVGQYGGTLIENGSIFIEMDTKKGFYYDQENKTWVGGEDVAPAVEKTTIARSGYEISFPSNANDSLGVVTTSYTFPNITLNIGGNVTLAYLPFEESITDINGANEIEVYGETIYEVEDNGTYYYVRNRLRDIPVKDGNETVTVKQPESYTYSSATKLNKDTLEKLLRGYEVELLMEDGTMFTTSTFPGYYIDLTDEEKKTIFKTTRSGANRYEIAMLNDGAGAGAGSNPQLTSNDYNYSNSMVYFLDSANGNNWISGISGISNDYVYRDSEKYGASNKYYVVFYCVGVASNGNTSYICRKGTVTFSTNPTNVTKGEYYKKIDNANFKYGLDNSGTPYFKCVSCPDGYTFSIPSLLTGKYRGVTTNPLILSEEDLIMCFTKAGLEAKDFEGRFVFAIRNAPGMQVVFGHEFKPIEVVNIKFKDVRGTLLSNEGYFSGSDVSFQIKKGTSLADYGYSSLAVTGDTQPKFPSSVSSNGTSVDSSFFNLAQNEDLTIQMVI